MSLTEVYHIASMARSKLQQEADQAVQDLRKLVGHASKQYYHRILKHSIHTERT